MSVVRICCGRLNSIHGAGVTFRSSLFTRVPSSHSFLGLCRGSSKQVAKFHHDSSPLVGRALTFRNRTAIKYLLAPAETATNRLFLWRSLSSSSSSSSGGPGFFGRIQDSIAMNNTRRQEKEYAKQLERMASAEEWSIQIYLEGLRSSLSLASGWRSMIPGVSKQPQIKSLKQAEKLVKAIVGVIGHADNKPITVEDLRNLDRKDKLRIVIQADCDMEDMDILIAQFEGMEIVHRILRRRRLDGLPIPSDEQALKNVVQTESEKVLSSKEKRQLRQQQMDREMARSKKIIGR